MDSAEIQPIDSNSVFFASFRKTSLVEKIAHWSKLFCYGFIILTIGAIIINQLVPFAGSETDLFLQLLFLLIFWGTVELLTVPFDHIQDEYVVNFQKNWISLKRQRFFYQQVKVLASFNQIKAIGVSQQPPLPIKTLNRDTSNNYAIFLQTLSGELIQISDFNLDLESANSFCHRLYSSHFSGAAHVGGFPGTEIFVDPQTETISTRAAEVAPIELVKRLVGPVIHAALAFMLTFSVLALALSIIERASKDLFSTDLQITDQPVFCMLWPHAGKQLIPEDAPSGKDAEMVKTFELPFPEAQHASATIKINISQKQILTPLIKDSAVANKSADPPVATTKEPQEPDKTKPEIKETIEKASIVASYFDYSSATSETSQSTEQKSQPEQIAEQKTLNKQPLPTPRKLTEPRVAIAAPVNMPLTARVPVIASLWQSAPAAASHKSVETKAKKQAEATLLPGIGIHPLVTLGTKIDQTDKSLGFPHARHQVGKHIQLIFHGITVIADKTNFDQVSKIAITAAQGPHSIKLVTPQGLKVGSKISEVSRILGPHTLRPAIPGLHFTSLGISFIPSPANPKIVGAIQIYSPH
jgi:hypothetical protein